MRFTIRTQMFGGFAAVLILLAFAVLFSIRQIGVLRDLQDKGFELTEEAAEAKEASGLGDALYGVIADAVINHNLEESEQDFKEARASAEKLLAKIGEFVDTDKERGDFKKGKKAFDDLVSLYETEMFPLLKRNAEISLISAVDAKIDDAKESLRLAMDSIAVALAEESKAGDSEFDSIARFIDTLLIVIALVALLTGSAIAWVVSRRISTPIRFIARLTNKFSEGDCELSAEEQAEMSALKGRSDEIGEMSASFGKLSEYLKTKAAEATRIAAGDLKSVVASVSANDVLGRAFSEMQERLSDVVARVQSGAEQIGEGAAQVADASQSLSQGATEQAASLEEISSSMVEVGSQAKGNATSAAAANDVARATRQATSEGADHMQSMLAAMNEIQTSSRDIVAINKVIDDIAFQTNLLALNAAVEAARAGRHGKGFAVVAEEVRNLAARSAKAARETAAKVDDSLVKVENGTTVARKTMEALEQISDGVKKVNDFISEISAASNEQAQAVAQISQGLNQIDMVTQQNTANAEETASAAEELSGHSRELKELLSYFEIKRTA